MDVNVGEVLEKEVGEQKEPVVAVGLWRAVRACLSRLCCVSIDARESLYGKEEITAAHLSRGVDSAAGEK